METSDLILWAIALLVTIIFGILGIRSYNRKNQQYQKTKKNSEAIQAGRDVNYYDKR